MIGLDQSVVCTISSSTHMSLFGILGPLARSLISAQVLCVNVCHTSMKITAGCGIIDWFISCLNCFIGLVPSLFDSPRICAHNSSIRFSLTLNVRHMYYLNAWLSGRHDSQIRCKRTRTFTIAYCPSSSFKREKASEARFISSALFWVCSASAATSWHTALAAALECVINGCFCLLRWIHNHRLILS